VKNSAAQATAIKARPFICTAEEVRGILGGPTTRLLRPVKVPKTRATNDGKPCGLMLYDLSRAWVDHGFPTDDSGEVLPVERWSRGSDPAPESAYREHYLHVPVAHPVDGWERNPSDDRLKRVYCSYGLGDQLWVRETFWRDRRDRDGVVIFAATPEFGKYRDKAQPERATFPTGPSGPLPTREECQHNLDMSKFWSHVSAHFMPRWAARILLEVAAIRIERSGDTGPWMWAIEVRRIES
jgi:hypothetical protein